MRSSSTILPSLLFAVAIASIGCGSSADAEPAPGSPATGDDDGGSIGSGGRDGGAHGDDGGGALSDGGANPNGDAGEGSGDAGHGGLAGLHVVNGVGGAPGHVVDGDGNVVKLHGVDRSGTEFMCLSGNFSDGPADQASLTAMKSWHVDSVRVPLNEDCWLGINGVPAAYSGAAYQKAVADWVSLITSNGMVAILDLHWTAAGTAQSNAQQPMADADHAPTFWSQVATAFKGNGAVIFDLFNEPYITDWTCWTKGGTCSGVSFPVAGMATLLQAVRKAGADNVVILGGLAYSSDLTQWATQVASIPTLAAPLDGISIANVAASWHAYDFNGQSGCPSQYNGYSGTCRTGQATAAATDATGVLAAGFPVILGEAGISAYDTSSASKFSSAQITDLEGWLDGLFTWAEGQGQGYLAWSWNTDTTPVLITDFNGTPTIDFGVTYQAHLKNL